MEKRGQSGNVLLILIFGLFLACAGGAYFFWSGGSSAKVGHNQKAAYDEAVSRLEQAMADSKSLDNSLGRNSSSFSCLFTANADCKNQGGTFLLYPAGEKGQPVSQMASDSGLTVEGAACKGYPSENCPVHVETTWQPVCAPNNCENTRSLRVTGKVTFHGSAGETPLEWSRQETYNPVVQLSQAVTCERGGGVWYNTECLTPAQVSERQLASSDGRRGARDGARHEAVQPAAALPTPAEAQVPQRFQCPDKIVVQDQVYPIQQISEDRAQVSVQAMSCPAEGVFDVFIFQCAAKSDPTFPGEGQWIQVEAVMAPACDASGHSLGENIRF
jgi:hypothetical protein